MRRSVLYFFLVFLVFGFISCSKELSLENRKSSSRGSLKSDVSQECLPKTLEGSYIAGKSFNDSNYLEVAIDVTKTGSYFITTDTLNGYYFEGSGNFGNTGMNTIRLKAVGKPLAAGTDDFLVSFDSSFCFFTANVLSTAISSPALYTLQSNGSSCLDFALSGVYATGVALNAANKVDIKVAVTTVGSYSLTTSPVSGITFSGSGTFTTTGIQTITLQASGTPSAAASISIPISIGNSTCRFPLTIGTPAAGTITCAGTIPNGTYNQGTPLTAANTVQIQVNVTAAGVYSISTNTANGFSFSKTGNFTTTGMQTVILVGSGTPVSAATSNFTASFGGSTCTFPVAVVAGTRPPPTSTYFWRFTSGGVSYQGGIDSAAITTLPPMAVLNFTGTSTGPATGDTVLNIILSDVNGAFTVNETYSTSVGPTANAGFFEVAKNVSTLFAANPISGGPTLVIKITAHNTTTKVIEGTFDGTAKDGAGALKTITAGQFKVNYR